MSKASRKYRKDSHGGEKCVGSFLGGKRKEEQVNEKKKLWKVTMLSPYCIWEGVEAESEREAINQVMLPDEYDYNDPYRLVAEETDEETEDE